MAIGAISVTAYFALLPNTDAYGIKEPSVAISFPVIETDPPAKEEQEELLEDEPMDILDEPECELYENNTIYEALETPNYIQVAEEATINIEEYADILTVPEDEPPILEEKLPKEEAIEAEEPYELELIPIDRTAEILASLGEVNI